MPSYQLFEIKKEFNIEVLQKEDILNQINANQNDPQTLKLFVESAKKAHRNLSFNLTKKNILKMNFDEYRQFQDKQTLWINLEKLILKHQNLLLVGKTDKKMEKVIQLFLRDLADTKPLFFKDKQLWQIWKGMSTKAAIDNLEMKLHRLIIKNTFIEADKIKELNLHSNDISNLGIVGDIVKQSERIKAITIKIKGFYSDNKWTTVRIDKNGSVLLYGKHEPDIIVKFLDLFIQSI